MPARPATVTSAETTLGVAALLHTNDVADDHAVVLHATPSRRPLAVLSCWPKLKPPMETTASALRPLLSTPRKLTAGAVGRRIEPGKGGGDSHASAGLAVKGEGPAARGGHAGHADPHVHADAGPRPRFQPAGHGRRRRPRRRGARRPAEEERRRGVHVGEAEARDREQGARRGGRVWREGEAHRGPCLDKADDDQENAATGGGNAGAQRRR